jgi:hypothetical protein
MSGLRPEVASASSLHSRGPGRRRTHRVCILHPTSCILHTPRGPGLSSRYSVPGSVSGLRFSALVLDKGYKGRLHTPCARFSKTGTRYRVPGSGYLAPRTRDRSTPRTEHRAPKTEPDHRKTRTPGLHLLHPSSLHGRRPDTDHRGPILGTGYRKTRPSGLHPVSSETSIFPPDTPWPVRVVDDVRPSVDSGKRRIRPPQNGRTGRGRRPR